MSNIRLFDGHCDTALELCLRAEAIQKNTCHIDLDKASAFRVYAQVFAFCSYAGSEARFFPTVEAYLTEPLAVLREQTGITICQNAAQVAACAARHAPAALLSLEGPEVIGCDPERLDAVSDFVMTTLTWNADNALAGCHLSDRGLTEQGSAFVRAAQQRGILIDVSHLGERSFWELLDMTTAPILASHSNCRALCENTRNLTDDQLRAIADSGGTVGLNLYAPFLGGRADFETIFRHLEHMLTVCGEKHVALGGDLDGCDRLAEGFSSVKDYEKLYHFLRSRGFDEPLLDAIFYENLFQLLTAVR